jgi:hypothetical protein
MSWIYNPYSVRYLEPAIIVAGDELNLENKEGVIWEGYNRKSCRRILVYRTPGITPDMFERYTIKGTNKPFYVVRRAKPRWTRLGDYETSVFIVPNDGSPHNHTTCMWVGRGPFTPISTGGRKEDIKINDKTFIDRKCYQMCLATSAVWICYDELVYKVSRNSYETFENAAELVGTRDEIIARALAGDKTCQQITQGLNIKLQQIQ